MPIFKFSEKNEKVLGLLERIKKYENQILGKSHMIDGYSENSMTDVVSIKEV